MPCCMGLPIRHACCCTLLLPGQVMSCLMARMSLLARTNSAAPKCSSSLSFWVWNMMASMNLPSIPSLSMMSMSAKTSLLPTQCCLEVPPCTEADSYRTQIIPLASSTTKTNVTTPRVQCSVWMGSCTSALLGDIYSSPRTHKEYGPSCLRCR